LRQPASPLGDWNNAKNEGQAMRDIRGDLQDRAALLEEQLSAHEAQFDKLIDQLKREHDQRLEDLKTELEAVNRLLDLELRRIETAPAAQSAPAREPVHHAPRHAPPHAPHQPAAHAPHQAQAHNQAAAQPQVPLADFLVRKLNEAGAMSRDDLRRFSLQEGYFVDAESADRGVHTTLLSVVKAGLIRQLPNGNFAPASVLDTIRLRRAM
jgi:cell division protein FtsN